ncbi:MAG TPA: apolipoprotein N-acyltransferase [Acetobacteraceae bacterium]|nr:apolipoprotein N-acyltransferase [Acetobacteraceae bacterium]
MPSRLRLRLAALHGLRADLAAFFLGALAAAALPPFHVIPILLVSVPGLLALLDAAPSVWVAARRGWWFGLGHHVLGLYWITEAILFEAGRFWWLVPLAVPAVAAVLALFIAVACFLARLATRGWPRVVALAGAWVLTDLARQFVLTGFPWNLWGSVWEIPGPVGDVLIQPAALVGVHGLTMATVFLAALPTLGRRWWLAGGAMLAAWAAFGLVRLQEAVAPQPLTVVLEQGNVAQGQKFDRALASRIFQHYVDLSSQGGQPRAAVDVWPETAFPGLLDLDERARQIIEQVNGGTPSLIGSIRFGQDRRPRNSLFAVVDKGAVAGVYDKWHLVPFGEYIPDWLPLPIIVLPGEGFAPGPGPRTLHVPGLPPVGPLICYEAIFSAEIVDRTDRPEWLVNITNDAWFGNSTGPRQHLAAARMRAVEEGLPLLRAANTGISAAFDAHGHELGRIGMQTSGSLSVRLPGALPPTPYARFGLWAPAMAGFVALGTGLAARRITSRSRSIRRLGNKITE